MVIQKMKLECVKRGEGYALAIPKALITSGVASVEVGKTYEVEIKEAE